MLDERVSRLSIIRRNGHDTSPVQPAHRSAEEVRRIYLSLCSYIRPVDDIAFLGCRLVSSASNCHRLRYAEVPGHLHCDKDPSLGCRSQLFCRQPTSLEQSITSAESWTGEFNRLLEKHLIVYCWNSDVYLQLPCMFIVCRVYMNLRSHGTWVSRMNMAWQRGIA